MGETRIYIRGGGLWISRISGSTVKKRKKYNVDNSRKGENFKYNFKVKMFCRAIKFKYSESKIKISSKKIQR